MCKCESDLKKKYDILFELYVRHLHSHRLGAGGKCQGCIDMANSHIERELSVSNTSHVNPDEHEVTK